MLHLLSALFCILRKLKLYTNTGICKVDDKIYNKTIQFFDITYQLAQNDDKTAIFENYCDFLNYFDQSITVQLSFLNHNIDVDEFHKQLEIGEQEDNFNDIRQEYVNMLKNQLSKGNNGLVKTKYVTFGIEADSLKEAKPKLERIQTDIINNFKVMGVTAYALNGAERLQILHSSFNPDGREKFNFEWGMLAQSGLSVKDCIAPSSFEFSKGNSFKMDGKVGAVSFIQILASEMSDRMLADFLSVEHPVSMSIHLKSIDQNKAIKTVKRTITDLDKMKIEEQKKAFRNGYDIDVIPSDISTYGKEAKSLLNDLQSRNERLFMATILIMNTADSKRKLDNILFQEQGIAQKYNCQMKRLDFQQNVEIADIVTIMGNLLDNAINAVMKVEERKIYLKIAFSKGNIVINIQNTFNGEIQRINGEIVTTGGDGHGYGLKNIRNAVDKYNGYIDIQYIDKLFSIDIFLYAQAV